MMTGTVPCERFPGEICLLPEARDGASCLVCRTITGWINSHAQYILVREIRDGKGLYVFPVSGSLPSEDERRGCVLELRIGELPLREIHQAVNTYLLSAEESW